MKTIELKINDKIYDKFLWLLSRFSKSEIQIININRNTKNNIDLDNDLVNIQSNINDIVNNSESFNFLNEEQDLYSTNDLIEKF